MDAAIQRIQNKQNASETDIYPSVLEHILKNNPDFALLLSLDLLFGGIDTVCIHSNRNNNYENLLYFFFFVHRYRLRWLRFYIIWQRIKKNKKFLEMKYEQLCLMKIYH